MPRAVPAPVVNRLLARLPRHERARVLRRAETVQLAFGTVLAQPGVDYAHVYFPLDGSISTVDTVEKHPPFEISLVGAEGMLGATVVLGLRASPLRAIVQGAGRALRLTLLQFERLLRECPALLRLLKRYLNVLVNSRLARWLMSHTRTRGSHFHLTPTLGPAAGLKRYARLLA